MTNVKQTSVPLYLSPLKQRWAKSLIFTLLRKLLQSLKKLKIKDANNFGV